MADWGVQKRQPITAKPNGGNGENDKNKIKLKVGHLRKNFSNMVKYIIFFNWVRKKKF